MRNFFSQTFSIKLFILWICWSILDTCMSSVEKVQMCMKRNLRFLLQRLPFIEQIQKGAETELSSTAFSSLNTEKTKLKQKIQGSKWKRRICLNEHKQPKKKKKTERPMCRNQPTKKVQQKYSLQCLPSTNKVMGEVNVSFLQMKVQVKPVMWVQLSNPEMKIENENLGQWQWKVKVKSQEDGGCWFHPDGSLTRIEQRAFVKI